MTQARIFHPSLFEGVTHFIVLEGFNTNQQDTLKRHLTSRGGQVVDSMSTRITHVISSNWARILRAFDGEWLTHECDQHGGIHFVLPTWVFASIQSGGLLSESEHDVRHVSSNTSTLKRIGSKIGAEMTVTTTLQQQPKRARTNMDIVVQKQESQKQSMKTEISSILIEVRRQQSTLEEAADLLEQAKQLLEGSQVSWPPSSY